MTAISIAAVRIWFDGERGCAASCWPGCSAAFTAANELPALSFFAALIGAGLLWKPPADDAGRLSRRRRPWWRPASSARTRSPTRSLVPAYAHAAKARAKTGTTTPTSTADARSRQLLDAESPSGCIVGEASRRRRSTPCTPLVGHHGIFLADAGVAPDVLGWACRLGRKRSTARGRLPLAHGVCVSLVCLAFYLSRPLRSTATTAA